MLHYEVGFVMQCRNERFFLCGTPIAQLIEQEISNLGVASLSPSLGTVRNGPPIHPVVKWVTGQWCKP